MIKTIVFLGFIFLSLTSRAAFECDVKIVNVLIYSSGSVNVLHTGRGDYTVICNLNSNEGVGMTTCAMWASMLQNIKKNNGTAQFYYEGNGSCQTLPTYASAPTPVYIGDMSQ